MPQFHLVISKIIFALSSDSLILYFSRACVLHFTCHAMKVIFVVQNYDSNMWNLRQFSALPRGCDIARYNVGNDCRQVRAFLYICSFQWCYPVVIEPQRVKQ